MTSIFTQAKRVLIIKFNLKNTIMNCTNTIRKTAAIWLLALACIGTSAQTYVTVTVTQPLPLQGNPGADTLICLNDSTTLGGSPTASDGTAPYVYSWTPITGLNNPTDANPVATPLDTTTYVLTMTDAMNCTFIDSITVEVEVCIGINEPSTPLQLAIFPNPNNGEFQLSLDARQQLGATDLSIYSAQGTLVYNHRFETLSGSVKKQINLTNLASGIYLIRITGEETSLVQKFHKQ